MGACEWDDAASWLLSSGEGGMSRRTSAPLALTDEQREVLWIGRDFELDPKWDWERQQGALLWGV